MKIGIISSHLPPVAGGIETHVGDLSRLMAENGNQVILIGHLEPFQGKDMEYEKKDSYEIYRVGFINGLRKPSRAFNKLLRIIKENKKRSFAVLHAHQIIPEGILALVASIITKTPLVITEHGAILNNTKSIFERIILRCLFKSKAIIITASNELKDLCLKNGARSDSVYTFSNFVDISKYFSTPPSENLLSKYGLTENDTVVLVLRRITPKTGVQYLVKMAPEIIAENPNLKFLIVGDSPAGEKNLKADLVEFIKKNNLQKNVIFAGKIDREDIPEHISICDFAVFPSLAEATSIAALEIMACGKPVVASNVGGLPEIIEDGINGLLVDFDQGNSSYSDYGLSEKAKENLKNTVLDLSFDKNRIIEMGVKAGKSVKEKFGSENYYLRLKGIIDKIV